MAMKCAGGTKLLQTPPHFTPLYDVVPRFESSAGLRRAMAKLAARRIPPARENRGNRLVPLLADDAAVGPPNVRDDDSLVARLADSTSTTVANATSA